MTTTGGKQPPVVVITADFLCEYVGNKQLEGEVIFGFQVESQFKAPTENQYVLLLVLPKNIWLLKIMI